MEECRLEEQILVTGGTGFVAMHLIIQLLEKGYSVKTTVRSLTSKEKVLKTLKDNGATQIEKLMFVEADLTEDAGWDKAMENCKYVFSVASPVFFDQPKKEEEAIRPAVEGILRILKNAAKSNVKRVVMTSNFGAIGFSNKNSQKMTTEDNWTDEQEPGLSIYEKSKLLAEKAAWDFVRKQNKLELVTINPVAVFGPSLDSHVSGSFGVLQMILSPKTKRMPNIPLNVVDVRDVADLHICAMTSKEAAMQRFIASAEGEISFLEMAQLIKKERPKLANQVTEKVISSGIIHFGALFNKQAREGSLLLKINRKISHAKTKEILDWSPSRSKEEAILSAVDSLTKYHLIK